MNKIPTKVLAIGAACLLAAGLFLIVQALTGWIGAPARSASVADSAAPATHAVNGAERADAGPDTADAGGSGTTALPATSAPSSSAPTPTALPVISVVVDAALPDGLRTAIEAAALDGVTIITGPVTGGPATGGPVAGALVQFDAVRGATGQPIHQVTFAAATRFDTIDPAISWDVLRSLWQGRPLTATVSATADTTADTTAGASVDATATATGETAFTAITVLSNTLPLLTQVLGAPSPAVAGVADLPALVAAAWQDRTTLVLLPFDQLEPRLAVLALDGQNPVENRAHFNPAAYPLVAEVYAHVTPGAAASRIDAFLAGLPAANRDAAQLTVLAMTGVTAMCRTTAAQMERFGPAWPAEIVGPELASADITHISNEVPFVEDCVPNTDPDNFNFCSKPEYIATLTASGADIIGMTGNHQNDFGRQNAMTSLAMYDEWGLPYYGGGKNLEEAFKPLFIDHNGNRFAFLGANSYGPQMAWATDALPGSAPFDLNILSATIRSIKEKGLADIVLVELQYQESYDPQPLADQRLDFNALVRAGADIVTGVQSHVPQGMEFTDGRLVLYGLGNLYFDQMWAQATREGMVVKHTFYRGRHISTQILTTLLYDYGQPRWTSPQERATILKRVFGASYW